MIATRGQVSSQKGRPINLKVLYKGTLSSSSYAITQRDRVALLNTKAKALKRANSVDCVAKYQLYKKLKGADKYKSEDVAGRKKLLATAQEELDEKRFRTCKSGKLSQLFITPLYL